MLPCKRPPWPEVAFGPGLMHGVPHLSLDLLDVLIYLVHAKLRPNTSEGILVLLLLPLRIPATLRAPLLLLLLLLLRLPTALLLLLVRSRASSCIVCSARSRISKRLVCLVDDPELRRLPRMEIRVTLFCSSEVRLLYLLGASSAWNLQYGVVVLRCTTQEDPTCACSQG